jgi:hypothetical protein
LLPEAVRTIRQQSPKLDSLLALLASLTGQAVESLQDEVADHIAARIFFLLLEEARDSPGFDVLEERLAARLPTELRSRNLSEAIAQASVNSGLPAAILSSGLRRLPYPIRERISRDQGNRCAVCGIAFQADVPAGRTASECEPSLDHAVPLKLGGDQAANLRITCTLCNSIKGASIHVGENGRVWIGNSVYVSYSRTVAFWTLARDKRCTAAGCTAGPGMVRLFAVRAGGRAAVTLDNCIARCERHLSGQHVIQY